MIRQKILIATTPRSKARVIKELTEELKVVNQEITDLQRTGSDSLSPERSHSVSSSTAVPIVNPSAQTLLTEKFKLRDQIQTGLKTLEERERKE